MRAHRAGIHCAALSCVGLLVSCGGSYGGGDGSARATVALSINPTTITLGQSATITWNSNGGACSANGEWTGNKPASGTETVTPTRTGTLTYSLVCSGGGYNESETLTTTLTVNPATGFTPTVIVTQFAGSSAAATDPSLIAPSGLAVSTDGAVWVMTGSATGSPAGIVLDGTDPAAITSADLPGTGAALYTGLALATDGGAHFLYATDFRNSRIDVFDAAFARQAHSGFVDPQLPAGFAPFGIQALDTGPDGAARLYVTYAQRSSAAEPAAVKGAALGLVNVFDTGGRLLQRFEAGALDAPWGIALAPKSFGALGGALLIGNSGDGTIGVYDVASGAFLGAVSDARGRPIAIPGLWGLASDERTLFFAASTDDADGLYGRIDPDPGAGTTQ
jgi:hypothetical protein